jgi:D-lactate dehydrogenase
MMYALVPMVTEDEGHYLASALQNDVEVHLHNGALSEVDPQLLARIEILLPFIQPAVGLREMETMPRLKLISTRSTGYDHIDLEAANERGIVVTNVPGYGEIAVAEHTIALILTLSRKLHLAYSRTRRGDFSAKGLEGFDVYGKTLGVIGTGAIGLHVIRVAKGLGMHVVAYDVFQRPSLAEKLGFQYVALDELLPMSDIVTLHAPALPSTQHMLNRETLGRMKHGALLVNTARGTLVDTQSLLWALETGILSGAALDALEGETDLQQVQAVVSGTHTEKQLELLLLNRELAKRDDVVITPHIAYDSREAHLRILDTTIENVRAFLHGEVYHRVNSPLAVEK